MAEPRSSFGHFIPVFTEPSFFRGNGTWLEPFDEFAWGGAYIEGGVWQYNWAVQHDPAGLIERFGGAEKFVATLDHFLSQPPRFNTGSYPYEIHEMTEMALANFGQYAHSNQPVHHVLYLFACAGQPWKTQYRVRRVLDEMYCSDENGFPGDEDNGEMSAWYILSALGIFPLCPGHPSYVFGSPIFKKAVIHLPNGRKFVITSENNDKNNVYVRQTFLNGEETQKLWISHDEIIQGGTLNFKMGSQPRIKKTWNNAELPFSLSREINIDS